MDVIDAGVTGLSASGLTLGLVAGVKMYVPNAPSWFIFVASLAAGCLLSALFALGGNMTFDGPGIANVVIGGIAAGLTAAGISRADRSADEKRAYVQNQDSMK